MELRSRYHLFSSRKKPAGTYIDVRFLTGSLGQVVDPPPSGCGPDGCVDHTVSDSARVFERHRSPDRRRSHLKRHHGLSRAAQPQRRHHPDLDVSDPRLALPGHHVPFPPDRRHPLGKRNSDFATRAHRLRRPRASLPGDDRGDHAILIMAANTSFADFPRLGALHAGDGFLPKQLTYKGSRLVFSRGIVALALIASS